MAQAEPQAEPQPRRSGRPRPQYRAVEVCRTQRITPHMQRVTVTGDELAGFSTQGVAGHIRILLPAPGQTEPVLPTWGPNGPEYPAGAARPTSRAYTPRRWDPATLELDIDFVLHGDNGPASAWAARAKVEDKLVVVAPRRAYQPDPDAHWYLIAGDESALPAIGTVIEVLPASARALVYVEVPDAAEQQQLLGPAPVQPVWIHRGDALPGSKLEAAIRTLSLPEGRGCVWIACESMAMRNIRRHLIEDRGMDRGIINTQGYWKYGMANHSDHDTGEDI